MRVNVETRAIKESVRLGIRLSMCKYQALGRLVSLWESSQDAEIIECQVIDLLAWFYPDKSTDKIDIEGFIKAMLECGFIEKNGKNTFDIKGNKKHVDKLHHMRNIGRKGGKQTVKRTLEPAVERTPERTETPNTIQYNAIQKELPGASKDAPPPTEIRAAGLMMLEQAYKLYPKRQGNMNKKRGMTSLKSKIKTMVKYQKFRQATVNYSIFCNRSKITGTEMVKQFSTFVGEWEDWLIKENWDIPEQKQQTTNTDKREYKRAAEKIWKAAANPSLQSKLGPLSKEAVKRMGGFQTLGAKKESDGPFVINELTKILEDLKERPRA